jgi:hypothetical protein
MRRSISSSVSRRNAFAVFFQLLQLVFIRDGAGGSQLADLIVDFHHLLAQTDKRALSFHFPFHLFQFRSQRQIPRLGLAAHADIPKVLRSVAGVILPGTSAVAFAALAVVRGDGAPAKIAQVLQLAEQATALRLQVLQGLIHDASKLNVYTHSDYRRKKEKMQLPPTNLTHTPFYFNFIDSLFVPAVIRYSFHKQELAKRRAYLVRSPHPTLDAGSITAG